MLFGKLLLASQQQGEMSQQGKGFLGWGEEQGGHVELTERAFSEEGAGEDWTKPCYGLGDYRKRDREIYKQCMDYEQMKSIARK